MSHLTFLRKRRLGRLWSNAPTAPLSLPGLLGWYDASRERGYVDLQKVSPVKDQSGRANPLTQATAGNQPIYYAAWAPACKPAYKPNGSSVFSNFTTAPSFAAGDSWTLVVHYNPAAVPFAPPYPLLYQADGARGLYLCTAGSKLGFKDENGNHDLTAAVGSRQTAFWVFDGTAGAIRFYRDTNGHATLVSTTAWTPTAFVPAVLWRDGTAGANYDVTEVGEMALYRGALGVNALAYLSAYLYRKWETTCPP